MTTATVEHGFAIPDPRIAVLSEAEFYGRSVQQGARTVKKLASRRKNVVDPLQLKPGDVVVHATHGIGKFVEARQPRGLQRRPQCRQDAA